MINQPIEAGGFAKFGEKFNGVFVARLQKLFPIEQMPHIGCAVGPRGVHHRTQKIGIAIHQRAHKSVSCKQNSWWS